jgi:indole-3-glycerol phosphate synthase
VILDEILAHKRKELAESIKREPLSQLKTRANAQKPAGPKGTFAKAVTADAHIKLIAEIKKASPSKGILLADFNPAVLARTYAKNNASALSVLTDRRFFLGEPSYLRIAKQVSRLPVLRKDFIIDEYQIWESLLLGADAVLLIAAALEKAQLSHLLQLAHELGLDALVEVHDAEQLQTAQEANAKIIGINNRDLRTFQTNLEVTLALAPQVTEEVILVSESGISTADDVRRLRGAGVDAILVGEALLTSGDIPGKMRELIGD